MSVKIAVLGRYLTVFGKLPDKRIVRDKAAFTVRDRYGIDLADLGTRKPRRFVGSNARAHNARLVTPDGVKGQRRTVCIGVDDFSVGNKTELDQCLEAVADAAHKTVALVEQRSNLFFYGGVAEEGCDKLTRTVRFVAAGKAARNKDNLR